MNKKITFGLSFAALLFPAIASAQLAVAGNNLVSLIRFAGDVLNMLIPILIAATLVVFFWGLVKYVWSQGGEGKEHAWSLMMAGLISLFVMVSVWGIIRVAQNTLGIGSGGALPAPSVPQR